MGVDRPLIGLMLGVVLASLAASPSAAAGGWSDWATGDALRSHAAGFDRGRVARHPRPPFSRPSDGADDVAGNGYSRGLRVEHRCFARRTESKSRRLCVHWVRDGSDAPAKAKRRTPPLVRATIAALKRAWRVEVVQLGFRPPRPDRGPMRGEGPNDGLDMYIADTGGNGLTGYCLNDSRVERPAAKPTAVYCVLDNDFAPRQVGATAFEGTVAHELFHAIQAAYELSTGDSWLDEGTATWMEQLVSDPARSPELRYPFLASSPLAQPETSLDAFGSPSDNQDNEYGAWVFWQFLNEYTGSVDPIRKVWEDVGRAGGSGAGNAEVVADSLTGVLPSPTSCRLYCQGGTFTDLFAEFELWSATFTRSFSHGEAFASQLGLSAPPLDGGFLLESSAPNSGLQSIEADHLSARNILVTGAAAGLRLTTKAPPADPDVAVIVQPYYGRTPLTPLRVALDANGRGSVVAAGATTIRILFVNATPTGEPKAFLFEVGQS